MHIPKTAGLTLQGMVRRRYKIPGQLHLVYSEEALQGALPQNENLQVIMGHFRFGFHQKSTQPPHYITFVREPIEQTISHYYYTFDQPEKFTHPDAGVSNLLEFARGAYGYNLQTRFLSGMDDIKGREKEAVQQAKENLLRHFAFIGISEFFDLSMVMLKPLLGWSNAFFVRENKGARRQKHPVAEKDRAALRHLLQPDREVYEFALELFYNQANKQIALQQRLQIYTTLNRFFQKLNPTYIKMKKITGIRFVFWVVLSMFFLISCKEKPQAVSTEIDAPENLKEAFDIEVHDSTALTLVDSNAAFEILAKGFYWSEGPLWVDELQAVLFSDVPANKIYKWSEKDSLSVYLDYSGHSGDENKNSGQGSNGLMLDVDGNLLICQHGDRRIAKLNTDLKNPQRPFSTVADSYQEKKLNSPNDLALDHRGTIYFTDPPYGQPDNQTGEIGINGVYKVDTDKQVSLLLDSLSRPNGIALSQNQQTLYINQSDPKNPVLYRYEISEKGLLEQGKVLFDFTSFAKAANGLPDGLKVHRSGNIFATGPGGVHIISPEGKHLATLNTGKVTANCAFSTDQKYLYMTASNLLLRLELISH